MLDTQAHARFESVVRSTYVPLQRYLRRRADRGTADDVLGDVLLVMWRRFDDIPGEAPLAWCYGVARRCLANAVRSAHRHQRLVRRLHEVVDPGAIGPSDDAELDGALARLPAADRELLRLWAWEQLPPREIAVVLGISPNAASIRLHRATRRLREALVRGKDEGSAEHPGQREGKAAKP